MMSLESDFARYKKERPLYAELAEQLRERAKTACRRAGLRCTVSARAKSLDSFVKKLIMKPQSYDEVFDKAGVRILPTYPDERDAVKDVVDASFNVTWMRDFVLTNPANVFDYRGLHLTIGLREDDRGGVSKELWPLVAELQIHRPGEAVWASVGHDLLYKSRLSVGLQSHRTARAMNRLSALLELVDLSMAEIRKELLAGAEADIARIIDAAERDFLRLRGVPFNEPLTQAIVGALRPLLGDVNEFLGRYQSFVEANEKKLDHVFNEYQGDFRHILLGQPESLVVFYLMEHDRTGLRANWPEQVPEKALDGLHGVWVPAG